MVSQKWVDEFNSNLACGCNWFSRFALFKVTLNSHYYHTYIDFKFIRFKTVSRKEVDGFNSNLACGCN